MSDAISLKDPLGNCPFWLLTSLPTIRPQPSDELGLVPAMKTFVTVVLWILASLLCSAEPRWCVVSEKDPSNTLLYPPIARAARVQGVVVMRMIYAPNGRVLRTEPVFGPVMLSNAVTSQLLNWTVKTDATGDQQCMTLMIAEFQFHNPEEASRPHPAQPIIPAILRISVESEVLVISDPGGVITGNNPFRRIAYKVRRLAKRVFHGPS